MFDICARVWHGSLVENCLRSGASKPTLRIATPLLASLIVASAALGGELDTKSDFRGIQCGSGPPPDMVRMRCDPRVCDSYSPCPCSFGWGIRPDDDSSPVPSLLSFYRRKKDRLFIGQAQLKSIVYVFYAGRFLGAEGTRATPNDGEKLWLALVSAFGEGWTERPGFRDTIDTIWNGSKIMVIVNGLIVTGFENVYKVKFVCNDILAAVEKAANDAEIQQRQRSIDAARPKAGDL